MSKKRKNSFFLRIRNYFITGVVVLIPIAISVYIVLFIINLSTKILPNELNPNFYLPFNIPGIEILIAFIFITIIGSLSLSFLGKKLLQFINDLFKRIPVLRTIYSAIVQMTETFTKSKDNKKSVVLIEYPKKGTYAIGFATKENTGTIKKKLVKN